MKRFSGDAEKIMLERFAKDAIIALATVGDGKPYVRYVDGYYEDGAFYTITYALSGKMIQINNDPTVALAGEWFTGHGTAVSLGYFGKPENALIAEKLREVFAAWIDNGHNDFSDENTIILKIELTDAVLIADGNRYEL